MSGTLGLLGLGLGIGSVVSAVLSELTRLVGEGAATVVAEVGHALDATTRPVLGAGFSQEYSTMTTIGALLSAPFLVLALVQAVAQQDLRLLGRAALVRLPTAILLAAAAVQLVRLSLAATDELSLGLLHAAGSPARALFAVLVVGLTSASRLPFGGIAALLFAGFSALLAFVLWLELAVRSAAVAAATLFLPLALAGLVWSATSHWARRLAETIAALVLSKLVIAAVLALAASTLGSTVAGAGPSGVVEGVSLLLLAAVSPFSLLRLLPMIESGAMGHLEGHARRPVHLVDPSSQGRRLSGGVLDLLNHLPMGSTEPAASGATRASGTGAVDPRFIGLEPDGHERENAARAGMDVAPPGSSAVPGQPAPPPPDFGAPS